MNRVRSQGEGFTRQKSTGFLGGYTIVETMIFLAVSGAIFLAAMLLVNGQQRKSEFVTAVRDFDSKLQSVISNVASGYYNNTGQTKCDIVGGKIVVTASGGATGQNGDCTFVGQYIDLAPANDKFIITSVAGARRIGTPPNDREAQSVKELYMQTPPILLLKQINETAEEYALPGGFKASFTDKDDTTKTILRIAVFTTFNTYKDSTNSSTLSSGSSRSDIWALNSSADPLPFPSPPGFYLNQNPDSEIEICLTDGEQRGFITLNTGSTRVRIENGNVCP